MKCHLGFDPIKPGKPELVGPVYVDAADQQRLLRRIIARYNRRTAPLHCVALCLAVFPVMRRKAAK
jgi:hypothetical protein